VLQDVVECAFGYVFPFILSGVRERERDERETREGRWGGGGGTDDEKDVGVLRLHASGDAGVFVARKVLRVDYGDDRV
jgi:hypothetical protein